MQAVCDAPEWTRTTTGKSPHKALNLDQPYTSAGVQIVRFVRFADA